MAILICADERTTLRPGPNVLGGRGDDAVDLSALRDQPPGAVIVVRPDAPAVIRALGEPSTVRIDGRPLDEGAHALRDGARVDVGAARLTFSLRAGTGAAPATPISPASTALLQAVGDGEGWRLIVGRGANEVRIPAGGATIGRDPQCDVVVAGSGVSRRHALLAPTRDGYAVRDVSANGTLVNGVRLVGVHALRPGDVIEVGSERLVVEVGAATPAPVSIPRAAVDATAVLPALDLPDTTEFRTPDLPAPPPATTEPPRATLRVRGPLLRAREFRLERPVSAVGRGDDNDVALDHASVSAAHATLLHKRGTWFVVDLGSANGTWVDGSRVAGERALAAGCTLAFGAVRCTFHPRGVGGRDRAGSTQRVRVGGLWRRLVESWEAR